jgi:hypothetical protein
MTLRRAVILLIRSGISGGWRPRKVSAATRGTGIGHCLPCSRTASTTFNCSQPLRCSRRTWQTNADCIVVLSRDCGRLRDCQWSRSHTGRSALGGLLIVVAIIILSAGMILDFVAVAAKRANAREARRRAGIFVPSALEVGGTIYVSFIHSFIPWRRRRRRRDGRRRAPQRLAFESPCVVGALTDPNVKCPGQLVLRPDANARCSTYPAGVCYS